MPPGEEPPDEGLLLELLPHALGVSEIAAMMASEKIKRRRENRRRV